MKSFLTKIILRNACTQTQTERIVCPHTAKPPAFYSIIKNSSSIAAHL